MKFYSLVNNTISQTLRTPQYLILFVSDKCWMNCRHCWFNEQWKKENILDNQLTFDELKLMTKSISRLYFLSITGGEAFIREDIVELTKMFATTTKLHRYQIPTSGFDTHKILSSTEMILKSNINIPFRVDVSLDGTENTHDYIRNVKGSYKNATKTIRELNKLKDKYTYFDVGVITTISNANQREINAISQIATEINPDGEWMINITRGETRDALAKKVDEKYYKQALDIIEERINSKEFHGHGGHLSAKWLSAKNAVRRQIIMNTLVGKQVGGRCTAGTIGGVIYTDGSIMPCEMRDETFGNIKDFNYNLKNAWNSNIGKEIRKKIENEKCICTQECFLSVSMLIRPECWLNMIKKRMKL